MRNREWNVVATIAVLVTLGYVGSMLGLAWLGRLEVGALKDTVGPVVATILGYLLRMLSEPRAAGGGDVT